jgi:Predicted metal-dependent hydrolase of the TIM-barrel fold
MRVIDCHVHLYPAEVEVDPAGWAALRGEKHWALLCTRRRRDGRPVQALPSVEGLLHAMDAGGVEQAVLLGWYWEKHDTCVWQNRFYAECVRAHPDRLSAFAVFHPEAGAAAVVEEVRRACGEGLIGIGEMSPHSQGFSVQDPAFGEVMALAGDLKLPVNLHAADPESRRYPGWVETPAKDFVWLARTFPRTNFVLAHWGGMLAMRDARLAERSNIFFDTAASPLLYDEKSMGAGGAGAGAGAGAVWVGLSAELVSARERGGGDGAVCGGGAAGRGGGRGDGGKCGAVVGIERVVRELADGGRERERERERLREREVSGREPRG